MTKTAPRRQMQKQKSSPVARLVFRALKSLGGRLRSGFGTFKSLAIALVMALLIKYSIIEAYNVPTGSMEDTIQVGDFLLANKFLYSIHIGILDVTLFGYRINLHIMDLPGLRDPRPGDIVVFKWPGDSTTNYVKRCIAVGGQTVEVRNKRVFVDSVEFHEFPHMKHSDNKIIRGRDDFGPYPVPKDCFFMMGDNRDDSYDSRYWGPVDRHFILGKALVVHWSWRPVDDRAYPKWDWSNPISWVANIGYNLIHFHQRVRWDRLGTTLL